MRAEALEDTTLEAAMNGEALKAKTAKTAATNGCEDDDAKESEDEPARHSKPMVGKKKKKDGVQERKLMSKKRMMMDEETPPSARTENRSMSEAQRCRQ